MAHYITLILLTISVLFLPSHSEDTPPRLIDRIIRDSAFLSSPIPHPKTSLLYNISLPSSLRGASADIARFRSGSLRRHGASVKEFRFSPGVVVHPHMTRLVVIRQNLGNHSFIYNISGFAFVTPVLGFLIYDAEKIYPDELEVSVRMKPITVNFSSLISTSYERELLCAVFTLDGKVSVTNVTKNETCVSWRQGHFAIVVTEIKETNSSSLTKMIVTGAVGGVFAVGLLGMVVVAMVSVKRRKGRIAEMERRAYEDEALQMSMVGHVRAPTAAVARTAPALENDYRLCL